MMQADGRGYVSSEKNRRLSPEEVVWARQAVERGSQSPKSLSTAWGMSVDSVRKMLRGDTYGNVGQGNAPPTTLTKDPRERTPTREDLPDDEAAASLSRLSTAIEEEKARDPDRLLEELGFGPKSNGRG
jgi:hypothetical protein